MMHSQSLRPSPQGEASFSQGDLASASAFYESNGYVVIRQAVAHALCDAVNAAFDEECLRSRRFIYRQATARAEQNIYTSQGFVLNAILNTQSVDPRHFGKFRAASVAAITAKPLQAIFEQVFGEPGKVVLSMHFHGNPETWPHQDTYYLDAATAGKMAACWIALEDIHPGAGRFFVCPRSHQIDMEKNRGGFDIAFHHDRYKQHVVDVIREHQLEFVAPPLSKGDVLIWSSTTIHGSLPTTQPEFSRRSITAHWIPQSEQFVQLQTRIKPLHYDVENGVQIARPKDQAKTLNRAVLYAEAKFPKAFHFAKGAAIKALTG